jgi:hypothetical protein
MRWTANGQRHTVRTEISRDEKRLLEIHAARRGVSVAALLSTWIAPRLQRLAKSSGR